MLHVPKLYFENVKVKNDNYIFKHLENIDHLIIIAVKEVKVISVVKVIVKIKGLNLNDDIMINIVYITFV